MRTYTSMVVIVVTVGVVIVVTVGSGCERAVAPATFKSAPLPVPEPHAESARASERLSQLQRDWKDMALSAMAELNAGRLTAFKERAVDLRASLKEQAACLRLMRDATEDPGVRAAWRVDSWLNPDYVGVTHAPSGWRYHLPAAAVTDLLPLPATPG